MAWRYHVTLSPAILQNILSRIFSWINIDVHFENFLCLGLSTFVASSSRKQKQWHFRLQWWRHQMEAFSALLALCAGNSPVPGEFPWQRPVTWIFDVFFDPRPNKRLSKQSWGWWLETLSRPLWRHCNDNDVAWASGCLKSLATRFLLNSLFNHQMKHQSFVLLPFVKGNCQWQVVHSERASYAESASISWRHHKHDWTHDAIAKYLYIPSAVPVKTGCDL